MTDNMRNVIGVCGHHNSGKTTLIVEIIKEMKKEGYTVVTVKNIPRTFSIDTEGKDTSQHADAGAVAVVASSANETAIILKEQMELKKIVEILNEIAKPDLIIVEGKKDEKQIPKIAIGDIEADAEFRYDGNFTELIRWIRSFLVSSGRSSLSGEQAQKD